MAKNHYQKKNHNHQQTTNKPSKTTISYHLCSRLHSLEDSFARCVGRITAAITAGVVAVALDEQPVPRFVVPSGKVDEAVGVGGFMKSFFFFCCFFGVFSITRFC